MMPVGTRGQRPHGPAATATLKKASESSNSLSLSTLTLELKVMTLTTYFASKKRSLYLEPIETRIFFPLREKSRMLCRYAAAAELNFDPILSPARLESQLPKSASAMNLIPTRKTSESEGGAEECSVIRAPSLSLSLGRKRELEN